MSTEVGSACISNTRGALSILHSHKGNVVLNGDPMNFGLVSAKDYADAVFLNGKGGSLEGGERALSPPKASTIILLGINFFLSYCSPALSFSARSAVMSGSMT